MSIERLKRIPGVVGVGVSKGSPEVVNVYVVQKTPEILSKIPSRVNGKPVRVIETGGEFQALSSPFSILPVHPLPTSLRAPLPEVLPGVSISHYSFGAGSAGFVATDGAKDYIVSSTHVLAPPNSLAGDPIVQPSFADGGSIRRTVALLYAWSPLVQGTRADAAAGLLVRPAKQVIPGIGRPASWGRADREGVKLIKSGRSTGVTEGVLLDLGATVRVNYPFGIVTLEGQYVSTDMADPGDSGSPVLLESDHRLIGIVTAGTPNLTLITPVDAIVSSLGLRPKGLPRA